MVVSSDLTTSAAPSSDGETGSGARFLSERSSAFNTRRFALSKPTASLLRGRGRPTVHRLVHPARPRPHHHHAVGQEHRLVHVVRHHQDRSAAAPATDPAACSCRLARVNASSAENGSSSSRISGCPISARAIATRCCWPPDRSRGPALAVLGQADPLQQRIADARLPLGRWRRAAPPKAMLSRDAQPGQQPRLLEHRADRRMRCR